MRDSIITKGGNSRICEPYMNAGKWERGSSRIPTSSTSTSRRTALQVEAALQWCVDAYSDSILARPNNIRPSRGHPIEGAQNGAHPHLQTPCQKRG